MMSEKRLSKIYPSGAWGIAGSIDDAIRKLAAYEDLGFSPDELREMMWVSVEERTPDPTTGGAYWIAKKNHIGATIMKMAQYCGYGLSMSIDFPSEVTWRDWDYTKITGVTHWMPLPRLPQGE